MFIGYQGDLKNYRLYDPATRRISISKKGIFLEEGRLILVVQSRDTVHFSFERKNEIKPSQDNEVDDAAPMPGELQPSQDDEDGNAVTVPVESQEGDELVVPQ